MSVNSHRHVQFPRRQSETSVYSGGSAAKDTYYKNKVRKVSPETGGVAAGALSYYYDEENESEREDFLYYHEQVRHEKYQRDPSQLRYLQNSLYETEYSPERRLLDHHHPKTDCFREEFPPNYNAPLRKSSVYSNKRFSHRSYDGNGLPPRRSLNEDCTIHEMSYNSDPDKKSYYLEKERSQTRLQIPTRIL